MGAGKRVKLDNVKQLELGDASWIRVHKNALPCCMDQFSAMWGLKPETQDAINMWGKKYPIPRFHKLYGTASYTFSKIKMVGDPVLPDLVARCVEYAQQLFPDHNWNGHLVNWYPTGEHYVSAHKDDEPSLDPTAPILSFSFGGVRKFRVRKGGEIVHDFETLDQSVLIMGGDMQKHFTHEIVKTYKNVGPRINITIRSFIQ